ncbi:hypothetical protein CRG98_022230 [Punica granatum]|uniref:Uncharacterized protein n=1 Tax=Punica granatum TaxID=22663 RepID=A0A2I0JM80_PUNGR|nr:hypothetical protein CRG98_022230 [Punica granatum]
MRRRCQASRDWRAWWLSGSMGGGGARVCWLGVRSRAEKVKLTRPGSISVSPDPISARSNFSPARVSVRVSAQLSVRPTSVLLGWAWAQAH